MKPPIEQRIAGELAALMARHGFANAGQLVAHAEKKGISLTTSTVWRIESAVAKKEGPKIKTLRKIAEAVGETMRDAFPSMAEAAPDERETPIQAIYEALSDAGRERLIEYGEMLLERERRSPATTRRHRR